VSALQFTKVSKGFPGPAGVPVSVLNDLSFELAAGESMAVVGPSGSGKSTLLNIAGTLDVADSGEVIIAGTNPAGKSDDELAKLRADTIGFVFQAHHLLPHCSVLENVLVPVLADRAKTTKDDEDYARDLISRVGLEKRIDHRPAQLSGGERQRVAVVRALIRKPKLILADEPTGALDVANAGKLAELLYELGTGDGAALLLVTHAEAVAALAKRRLDLGIIG
jgi:lipoprotein-releasing system ATP-binding protein